MCHGRAEPTKEECDEVADADTFLSPYILGQGARITMNSSVSLLSRYQQLSLLSLKRRNVPAFSYVSSTISEASAIPVNIR